ncbi:hypothetical protein NE237_023115 [Protea cynaroides]|uniref:Transmembrane and coiled-coil domain-containing protein 4 n=1 Tax=Protea cynaroides TaxID=273540 RepID=A0A9Q0HDA2_9MAGN|nr:hypothetical protein NE237_023115 [Protea cynaroides]
MGKSILTPTQRYGAGALLAFALHQAQLHQTSPLGSIDPSDKEPTDERVSSGSSSSDSVSEDPDLWIHENSVLLRPVFRFLDIDSTAWSGLEETAASSPVSHHVGAFLRLLSEESGEDCSERMDQELALTKAVDVMVMSIESSLVSSEANREKRREYENECREKISTGEKKLSSEPMSAENLSDTCTSKLGTPDGSGRICDAKPKDEGLMLSYQRKVVVLFELLSACVADIPDGDKKHSRIRKGYDARHRVALRLLATWLDVKWIKVEAMEIMVACSAMAIAKDREPEEGDAKAPGSPWAKWKRGGIIGAAAVTGGALLAITGGLAAPAIAAGFSALAPTLGTLVPVIGASGFAAAATAAGSAAGSVAVAASFGAAGAGLTGTKMARRTGNIDEFEFKAVGENHKQGRLAVGIVISGFVFEEDDFVRPWDGQDDNLERTCIDVDETRSDKAGKLLAEVLVKGSQGNRPVTLIGFSLGARVVFNCLQCLAKNKDNVGLIERVVLLGSPIPIQKENWETARKMVAGRFINAYSTNDWILGIAFRASLLTTGLAGIQPVNAPGIENVDVTELIEGHSSYLWATQKILERLELDKYYPVFVNFPDKSNEERS